MQYSFRLLAFNPYDDNTSSEDSDKNEKEFVVQMFGINEAGETASIFVTGYTPFFYVKIGNNWNGSDEKAFVTACNNPKYQLEIGKQVIAVDPTYFRPSEVDVLIGDASKAKNKLGWVPEHDLASLVKDMMASDINLMKKDQYLKDGGYSTLNYFE